MTTHSLYSIPETFTRVKDGDKFKSKLTGMVELFRDGALIFRWADRGGWPDFCVSQKIIHAPPKHLVNSAENTILLTS